MSQTIRVWLCAAFAALSLALISPLSARAQQRESTPYEPQPGPAEQKILAALAAQTSMNYIDQPLADVVHDLRKEYGIEIQLDNKALTDEGIGSDTPVTRRIEGISLESALRLTLSEMDMTYVLKNEVLFITTKTEAENMLATRMYPVGDLLASDADQLVVGAGDHYQELIEAITSLVQPTTWDEVGGPGSVQAMHEARALAISQTFVCHREIEAFLATMRAVQRRAAENRPAAAAANAADDATISLKIYKLPRHWIASAAAVQPPAPAVAPPAAAPPAPAGVEKKPAENKPAVQAAPAVHSQMGGGFGSGFQNHPTIEQLLKAIPAAIEPDTWSNSGGEGTISPVGQALAIRQTQRVHREIRRFLQALEQSR